MQDCIQQTNVDECRNNYGVVQELGRQFIRQGGAEARHEGNRQEIDQQHIKNGTGNECRLLEHDDESEQGGRLRHAQCSGQLCTYDLFKQRRDQGGDKPTEHWNLDIRLPKLPQPIAYGSPVC